MPCPGGLRDLTDGSASDAHINMTYVPYLHPAAVGPFRFAGYRILHLHLHGILHGMAVYGMYVCMYVVSMQYVRDCREKTPCSLDP